MRAQLLNDSFEKNEETGKWEFSRRRLLAGAAAVAAVTGMSTTAFARSWDRPDTATAEPQRYPDPDVVGLDPRFKYRAATGAIHRLWTGSRWAEGPAWSAVGRYVVFSDIPNNRQIRWCEDDGHVNPDFRNPSYNSNGLTFDMNGRQYACEHYTRALARYEHSGERVVLADKWNGKTLNGPNDVCVHPDDGTIFFTDPGYGGLSIYEGSGPPPAGSSLSPYQKEAVYRIDGKTGKMTQVATDAYKPNGVCFSADYKKLYVADTGITHYKQAKSTIFSYDINGEKLTNVKELVDMSMEVNGEKKVGLADGIRVDADGNIWAGSGWVGDGYDGVQIFAPNGDRIGIIKMPEIVANLCFAGLKHNRLIMCGSQSLYSVFVEVKGGHYC